MKTIRAFVIGFIGLVIFAACALVGTMIGFSLDQDLGALATAIIGLMIGSSVGLIAAIAAAKFFADHFWIDEKKTSESATK